MQEPTASFLPQAISGLGLVFFIFLAWCLSSNRGKIDWRLVRASLILQLVLAVTILWTTPGYWVFETLGAMFNTVIEFVNVGSEFVFSVHSKPGELNFPPSDLLVRAFAFGVMPTVIFFSSLMAVLYHLGIMQMVTGALAYLMQKTLRTSGAESLAVAANVFIGQTEAPLVVRPYLAGMTRSEMHALMVAGFSTVSGGLLVVYVGMGVDAVHLLTASVISAPASLLVAKIIVPETETPETNSATTAQVTMKAANTIEAAASGASEGMKLAINIVAMLIAFLGLIAMSDAIVQWCGTWFGFVGENEWTLAKTLGYGFSPIAWMMGIPAAECLNSGQLLGLKIFANEFIAYERLGSWMQNENQFSTRTAVIMTYALSGFSNFASIGIQIGGIGSLVPERRGELATFGLRAMLGGAITCCMTGCVAGLLTTV